MSRRQAHIGNIRYVGLEGLLHCGEGLSDVNPKQKKNETSSSPLTETLNPEP